jgi:hypothetical protein
VRYICLREFVFLQYLNNLRGSNIQLRQEIHRLSLSQE